MVRQLDPLSFSCRVLWSPPTHSSNSLPCTSLGEGGGGREGGGGERGEGGEREEEGHDEMGHVHILLDKMGLDEMGKNPEYHRNWQ